jgi:type VI protein secretion system component Hcp
VSCKGGSHRKEHKTPSSENHSGLSLCKHLSSATPYIMFMYDKQERVVDTFYWVSAN